MYVCSTYTIIHTYKTCTANLYVFSFLKSKSFYKLKNIKIIFFNSFSKVYLRSPKSENYEKILKKN